MSESSLDQLKEQTGFQGITRLEGETLTDVLARLKIPHTRTEIKPPWLIGLRMTKNWLYTYHRGKEERYAIEIVDEHPRSELLSVSIFFSVLPEKRIFRELVDLLDVFE